MEVDVTVQGKDGSGAIAVGGRSLCAEGSLPNTPMQPRASKDVMPKLRPVRAERQQPRFTPFGRCEDVAGEAERSYIVQAECKAPVALPGWGTQPVGLVATTV